MNQNQVFLQAQTINDIRKLKIPSAQSIDLSNNSITSLVGLPTPKIIKFLQVGHNKIRTIEEEQMKLLKSLCLLNLSDNQISKIENLFYLHHLHVLDLSNNNISVLENLEGNVNLKQLMISDNQIQTIFIRSPVPQLILLDISGNKLRRLTGITYFQCLSTLTADRNYLTSISQIKSLLNLRRISFCSNKITNFESFFLPILLQANFSMNQITSLSPFSQFQALVRLDLVGNPITDAGLDKSIVFSQLKELHLDGTQITDLVPLNKIAPNLVELTCAFSKISSFEKLISFIKSAKSLQYLDVRSNPVNNGLYPDADQGNVGEFHGEYKDESKYDELYPKNAQQRHKYRSLILDAGPDLIWLDGIKVHSSQDVVPPSELFFQELEDVNISNTSKDIPVSSDLQSYNDNRAVQCDISDSSLSANSNYSDTGNQTNAHHHAHVYHRNFSTNIHTNRHHKHSINYERRVEHHHQSSHQKSYNYHGQNNVDYSDYSDNSENEDYNDNNRNTNRNTNRNNHRNNNRNNRDNNEYDDYSDSNNSNDSNQRYQVKIRYGKKNRVVYNIQNSEDNSYSDENGQFGDRAARDARDVVTREPKETPFVPNYRPKPGYEQYNNDKKRSLNDNSSDNLNTDETSSFISGADNIGFNPQDEFDNDDVSQTESFSAATDLESDFFPHMDESYPKMSKEKLENNSKNSNQGCSFWIDVHNIPGFSEAKIDMNTSKDVIRTKRNNANIPPFRHLPGFVNNTKGGHYPFNTKEQRRLPWDFELDQLPPPPKKKKDSKVKAKVISK